MASVRSLSSRWLALTFAAAYLVVSVAVGIALLAVPKTSATGAGNPTTYIADDTLQGPAEVVPSPAPAGFQVVDGPIELRTVIPSGWQAVTAGGPGAMRAIDPSDAGRIVGYGGAKTTSTDLVGVHVAYEDRFAARTTNYRRVDLNSARYGGHPAVEWEFLHDDGHGTQRVHALYWLVADTEYFVFASGPDAQWSRMKPIYDAMVANSRP